MRPTSRARELDQLEQAARQGTPTAQRELARVCDEGASGVRRNPDRLDVERDQSPNLSFGDGIHHCPGAALVRQEGRIVFEMLPERPLGAGAAGVVPGWHDRDSTLEAETAVGGHLRRPSSRKFL